MLSRLPIWAKLAVLVTLLAASIGGVASVSIVQSRRVEGTVSRLADSDLVLLVDLNTLYAAGLQMGQATRNVVLNPKDATGRANFAASHQVFAETLDKAGRRAPPALAGRLGELKRLAAEDDLLRREVQRLAAAGERDRAITLLNETETPKWRVQRAMLLEMIEEQRRMLVAHTNETIGTLHRQREIVGMVVGATLAISGLLSLLIARSVTMGVRALVAEARRVVTAVRRGDLSLRAEPRAVSGDLRPVVEGINATADTIVGPSRLMASYLDRISRGDVPEPVDEAFEGELEAMKQSVNRCIGAVGAIVADVTTLTQAARAGDLGVRVEVRRHEGEFARIMAGMNATLDATLAPIEEAARVLGALEGRDLSARMVGDYRGDHARIKGSLNATATALSSAIAQVSVACEEVTGGAGQIASASEKVAEGASEQASAMEQTSASLELLSSRTQEVTASVARARALSEGTRAAAASGEEAIDQLKVAISRIRDSARSSSEIIGDINGIAFQTNLLALNAAVEAARAGEAGRGFAVVAEEVRGLALRSKAAATRTEALIRESVRHAGDGEATSHVLAERLEEIVAAAGEVATIVGAVEGVAKDQALSIDQITRAASQVGMVTQQNAASAEESSSVAQELASQAESLRGVVRSFQLAGDGGQGQARGAPARLPKVAGPIGRGPIGRASSPLAP